MIIVTEESINAASLWEVVQQGWREYTDKFPKGAYTPRMIDRISYAQDAGEILAFIVWTNWEGAAAIGLAWTRPGHRCKGIYKQLVQEVADHAARLKLSHVRAWVVADNLASIRAHERIFSQTAVACFERELCR